MRKIAFMALAAAAAPVAAATFQVSNLADSGAGSLRHAVLDANALPGADEITFQPGLTGRIILTSGEIAIKDDLDVSGPGAGVLTVDADHRMTRIFNIYDGTPRVIDVTISGLRLTGGDLYVIYGSGGAISLSGESLTLLDTVISDSHSVGYQENPGRGGCISASGTLKIERSVVTGCSAGAGHFTAGPGVGGNLFFGGGTLTMEQSTVSYGSADAGAGVVIRNGTAVFRDSTISRNKAGGVIHFGYVGGLWADQAIVTLERTTVSYNSAYSFAGGLSITQGASVLMIDSTVSGNQAELWAGGIYLGGGSELALRLSTLSGNTAGSGGGSIHVEDGSLDLDHSIVANGTPQDLFRESGTINADYSLVETPGSAINGTNANNRFGVDPNLGPLANNGGLTETHALLPGSLAIDAGNPLIPNPPLTDQRGPGFVRIFNGSVDPGSFERQAADGAVEIPALSGPGLAALMVMLAGAGLWVLRR